MSGCKNGKSKCKHYRRLFDGAYVCMAIDQVGLGFLKMPDGTYERLPRKQCREYK